MISRLPLKVQLIANLVGLVLLVPIGASAEVGTITSEPATAKVADSNAWTLHLPKDEPIYFRGMVSLDEAGVGSASFAYVVPNAGGFLAAVLTHGLIVESAKKQQKDNLQAAADKVLIPYKAVLDGFDHQELMRRTIEKSSTASFAHLTGETGDTKSERVVDSIPIFSMMPDQKTLILDNEVIIHMADVPQGKTYQNSVRIISSAKDMADPVAFWTSDDGKNLKNESARLEIESLNIALQDAIAAKDTEQTPFRTVRYQAGASEKFERAQVLSEQCERLVIRTLRGTLMSVPIPQSEMAASSASQCKLASLDQK